MQLEFLKDLVEHGREIEFEYKGKQYSITYYPANSNNTDISFCEFNKEPTDYKTVDELYNGVYNNILIKNIIDELNENEIDVY